MVPKRLQEHPEAFPRGQGHPGAPQETPRDDQKASLRAPGSALETLWTRLERHWGVLEGILRGDFETKMEIDGENADYMKIMLAFDSQHGF